MKRAKANMIKKGWEITLTQLVELDNQDFKMTF